MKTTDGKCPDYVRYESVIVMDECAHYGVYSGLCYFLGPFRGIQCPWKGKKTGKRDEKIGKREEGRGKREEGIGYEDS